MAGAGADVLDVDGDSRGLAASEGRRREPQVRVPVLRVAQAVTERKERLLREVRIGVTMLAAHLAVEDRLLADVVGERDRELAGRVQLAEERLGERAAALHAGVEALEDGSGALHGLRQHERLAVHEHDDHRLAGLR